jgi:tetratricopeptide (TPR) repeat protein
MEKHDSAGLAVSGANFRALEAYERACHELRCYIGDPVASVDEALAASPAMVMAHALKAWLHLLGTEPSGLAAARECLHAAEASGANDRERGHLRAIQMVLGGEWRSAGRVLEDVSAVYPRDALALQAGHQIDFFTGDARMLRDRIARALPGWSPARAGYHAVLGMYAFGLEECGEYAAAEEAGRRSVELEPRDGWGWHAVAHVHEMQNRTGEGIDWLQTHSDAWSEGSFFAVHNWWHLAVFQLDRGAYDEALRLYDGPIFGNRSQVALDMIDATALLWRLMLLGVNVGERWQPLADNWSRLGRSSHYAFNEWHAMMAFVGAHRTAEQEAVIATLEEAASNAGRDSAAFAAEVGLDAARAMAAFGKGRYTDAVRLLRPLRSSAHRFGGSHAQRDLLDLTLIESAIRAEERHLASALAAERVARRPASPLSRLFAGRAAQLAGASESGTRAAGIATEAVPTSRR